MLDTVTFKVLALKEALSQWPPFEVPMLEITSASWDCEEDTATGIVIGAAPGPERVKTTGFGVRVSGCAAAVSG